MVKKRMLNWLDRRLNKLIRNLPRPKLRVRRVHLKLNLNRPPSNHLLVNNKNKYLSLHLNNKNLLRRLSRRVQKLKLVLDGVLASILMLLQKKLRPQQRLLFP